MRLRQLAKAGFFPAPVHGQYEFDATIRGVYRSYQTREERTITTADEVARKLKAERRIKEAAADLAEGKQISFAVARRVITSAFLQVKTRLLGIPSAIAPICAGQDAISIETRTRAAVVDALRELTAHKWQMPDDEQSPTAISEHRQGARPAE